MNLDFAREAEIKHGRVAMLAFVGWVASDLNPLPNHDYGPLMAHDMGVKSGAMVQIALLITMIEAVSIKTIQKMLDQDDHDDDERVLGDYSVYRFFLPDADEATLDKNRKSAAFKDLQLKELENGRLAMLGFSGMVTVAAMFPDRHFPYC